MTLHAELFRPPLLSHSRAPRRSLSLLIHSCARPSESPAKKCFVKAARTFTGPSFASLIFTEGFTSFLGPNWRARKSDTILWALSAWRVASSTSAPCCPLKDASTTSFRLSLSITGRMPLTVHSSSSAATWSLTREGASKSSSSKGKLTSTKSPFISCLNVSPRIILQVSKHTALLSIFTPPTEPAEGPALAIWSRRRASAIWGFVTFSRSMSLSASTTHNLTPAVPKGAARADANPSIWGAVISSTVAFVRDCIAVPTAFSKIGGSAGMSRETETGITSGFFSSASLSTTAAAPFLCASRSASYFSSSKPSAPEASSFIFSSSHCTWKWARGVIFSWSFRAASCASSDGILCRITPGAPPCRETNSETTFCIRAGTIFPVFTCFCNAAASGHFSAIRVAAI
mmetsp:Transcript_20789/g.41475  ORF Transcript_20789/g.41475 Transcript_20789/m.41475 type:complete len:402 (-) Transcript_20789:97-1302(-)